MEVGVIKKKCDKAVLRNWIIVIKTSLRLKVKVVVENPG